MSQSKSSDVDPTLALEHEDEAVLIERVSSARRSGTDDHAAADELLRRAAAENKAALDRLGPRLQNSTIAGYKRIIRNHVTPYLGAIQLDKLTATRIAAHYRQLEISGRRDKPGYGKPLSANTVSKVHVLLAATLDAAVDDGLIPLNPAKKKRTVNPPSSSQVRAQKPEIVTWTGPQLHAFLTWNRDEFDDELFPLWRTIAYTGMRRSEALIPTCLATTRARSVRPTRSAGAGPPASSGRRPN